MAPKSKPAARWQPRLPAGTRWLGHLSTWIERRVEIIVLEAWRLAATPFLLKLDDFKLLERLQRPQDVSLLAADLTCQLRYRIGLVFSQDLDEQHVLLREHPSERLV